MVFIEKIVFSIFILIPGSFEDVLGWVCPKGLRWRGESKPRRMADTLCATAVASISFWCVNFMVKLKVLPILADVVAISILSCEPRGD